jgi:hypothetical protein
MKLKSLLIGASALGFAASAQAQTTVINITGATAFRSAAHAAIMASFNQAGALGTTWNYAWNGSSASGANNQIYKGTFPGIGGTTVIRTSWTGSVEGVRSLTKPTVFPETYLKDSVANLSGFTAGVKAGASEFETSTSHQFAFADMAQSASPTAYRSPKLNGGPIGVIAFLPVINEGADEAVTNITINQFRRLVSNGSIPLKMMTGNASSNGTIYNVQRNDGSGTRVIHLAEIGHGQANLTKGYVFNNLVLTSTPVLAPATGDLSVYGVSSGQNRVRFSNDFRTTSVLGNGGYVSGGSIASLMGQTSTGFNIISWLGTGDAKTSVTNGGRVLAYNGEKLDGVAGGNDLTTADRNKIALGKFSAWSFEQLFYVGTLTAGSPKKAVYDRLVSVMPENILSAGVSLAAMQVIRPTDGGVIAPKP